MRTHKHKHARSCAHTTPGCIHTYTYLYAHAHTMHMFTCTKAHTTLMPRCIYLLKAALLKQSRASASPLEYKLAQQRRSHCGQQEWTGEAVLKVKGGYKAITSHLYLHSSAKCIEKVTCPRHGRSYTGPARICAYPPSQCPLGLSPIVCRSQHTLPFSQSSCVMCAA